MYPEHLLVSQQLDMFEICTQLGLMITRQAFLFLLLLPPSPPPLPSLGTLVAVGPISPEQNLTPLVGELRASSFYFNPPLLELQFVVKKKTQYPRDLRVVIWLFSSYLPFPMSFGLRQEIITLSFYHHFYRYNISIRFLMTIEQMKSLP